MIVLDLIRENFSINIHNYKYFTLRTDFTDDGSFCFSRYSCLGITPCPIKLHNFHCPKKLNILKVLSYNVEKAQPSPSLGCFPRGSGKPRRLPVSSR